LQAAIAGALPYTDITPHLTELGRGPAYQRLALSNRRGFLLGSQQNASLLNLAKPIDSRVPKEVARVAYLLFCILVIVIPSDDS